MKHFKHLCMLLTAMLLSINVWGETATLTLDKLGASLTSTSNTTMSTVDITATGTTDNYTLNYLQGKKQGDAILLAKSTGAFIANATAMPGDIKSATVYINSGASGKTTYHCAFSPTACTSAPTTSSTAVNIVGGSNNKYTCSASGCKYFCISLGNANNGQVLKVEVEYEVAGGSEQPTVNVTDVSLDKTSLTLAEGATETLIATIAPDDATNKNVNWESSNESVATVANGVVTAKSAGSAIITVKSAADATKTATCNVTVNAFTPTAGEYEIALNNAFYGVSTGNNGTEQSAVAKGITVVSGCTSSASSKTYYDTDHIRYYKDSYLKLTAPDGFEITKVVFTANGTWNAGPTVTFGSYDNNTKTWTGNAAQLDMSFAAQNRAESIKVTYAVPATLQSITISGEPTKKEYTAGENFNPAGLTVTGNYSDESQKPITEGITWSEPAALTAGQTSVSITATVAGITSAAYEVTGLTVAAAKNLDHIALNTDNVTKVFWKDETFNYIGLVVTAYYEDETNAVVEPLSVSTPDMTLFNEAQTITVSYKEGGVTKEATYDIEVKSIANTQETAYTTAEAIDLIDAGKDLATEVYVKGTVSKIQTAWSDQYNNITYNISADGTESGAQFQLFRCVTNGYAEGDDIVAFGKLTKYNSTYELAAGNTIVAGAKAATFSIANISVANGEDITPEITTSIVGEYAIEYVSNNEEVVLAADDEIVTIGVGTATITATIVADGYKTKTTTFTVTVTSNATLESISIGGAATKTTYIVGDEMDYSGLTVTALYSDATTPDVTGVVEWSVSPATLAATTTNVTVTATYEGKTATKSYGVTVNKKVSSITIADFSVENTRSRAISATTTPAGANLTYEILTGADKVSLEGNIVTGTAEGTATIKAIYATTDTYQACEYTFTVTVTPFIPTKTWDLSIASYASAAENKVVWEDDAVDMIATQEKAQTKTNNYLGGTNTSTRFYKDSKLTFAPNGVTISSIVYEATTESYATTLANSTWTNATATADGTTVTITPTDGAQSVYVTMSNTTGAKSVCVKYSGTPSARLRSIALSGTYPTVFAQGDNFCHDGMIVTAEYTDNTTADVTESATFSGYDMTTPGTQTVTVSYTFNGGTKTAEYEITVNRQMTSQTKENVDFTELYSSVTGNQSQTVETVAGLSFDMFFAKPQSSTTPAKYYANGNAVRNYTGNTITINGADPILWVEVVWAGSYVDDAMTLEYSADRKTATLTFSKTCRFTAINVYYQEDYKRSGLIFGKIGTICLAEGVAYAEGGAFYEIEKKNPIGIDLIEAEMPLTPGKPYIFQSEGSEIKVIYTNETPATEVVEANGLVGNLGATNLLLPMLAEGHETYIFKDNHICKASGDNANYVAPGRAYLDYTLVEDLSVASPAPGRRRISLNDAEAEVATSTNALVSGEKAQKTIINGEIFILRNEKMYNAAGMLIK